MIVHAFCKQSLKGKEKLTRITRHAAYFQLLTAMQVLYYRNAMLNFLFFKKELYIRRAGCRET